MQVDAIHAIQGLVTSIVRAAQAIAYYGESHRALLRVVSEAARALEGATAQGGDVTLGCAGSQIVYDERSPGLGDESSKALAKCLFNRSIIALRLTASAQQEDLAQLLRLLAEGEDRIRARGGVRLLLDARARGIEVLEIDYAKLFAGMQPDLHGIGGESAVVTRALREVLHFQEGRAGETLSIDVDRLTTPGSLGGFLDDLIHRSQADPRGLSSGTVADLASRAFVANQTAIRRKGANERELLESARVLDATLARLSPRARVELLRALAGGDKPLDPDEEAAVGTLGRTLGNALIADTIASTLLHQEADRDATSEIGNLIRRLRPIERDRQEVLQSIQSALTRSGHDAGGGAWQAIFGRAMQREDLGYLKLNFERAREVMADAAGRRARGELPQVPGQEILATIDVRAEDAYGANVFREVLEGRRGTTATMATRARELVVRLEESGDEPAATMLLAALVRRAGEDEVQATMPAIRAPALAPPPGDARPRASWVASRASMHPAPRRSTFIPAAGPGVSAAVAVAGAAAGEHSVRAVLGELLHGPGGDRRTRRLLDTEAAGGALMAEIVLAAVDACTDRDQSERLIAGLSAVDARILERLAVNGQGETRLRAHALVAAAGRGDGRRAAAIVRHLLRSPSIEVKEAALRSVLDVPDANAIATLEIAAGAKGDEAAGKLFGVAGGDGALGAPLLHRLKIVAIGALGLTRSAAAVPVLYGIVTRPAPLLGDKTVEETRAAAVQALVTNGTREAKQALAEGARHSKKQVRAACLRAAEGARNARG